MVWGVNYPDLPMPTPGQMSPFNQAFQSGLENYMNINKAALDPLKTYAQAMSQLTYSNLMGPQFEAKLFGNKDVLPNIPNKELELARLQNAAHGGRYGTSPFGNSTGIPFFDKFRDWLHGRSPDATQNNQPAAQNYNAPQQQPAQQPVEQQPVEHNNQQPVLSQQPATQQYTQPQQPTRDVGSIAYPDDPKKAAMLNDWYHSPEAQAQGVKNGYVKQPSDSELTNWYERVGKAEDIKKESEKKGEIRATQMGELDDTYEQALNSSVPIRGLIDIVKNPAFQNLRKYPGFQKLQLSGKEVLGNPAEQKLIGDFRANATKAIAQNILSFRGRILDKEVTLSNQMKVDDGDNLNVIIGKLPAIAEFNDLTMNRSRIARHIMEVEHISKTDALERADKMVNGPAIKARIQHELEDAQMINIINSKTGQKERVSVTEARKRGMTDV